MPENQQSFRCFSKKDEDQWVSICIDLNLAAQADTQKESRSKLESMVRTYLYEANNCHSKYKDQLLKRKAPWSIRLEYHKIALLKFLIDLPFLKSLPDLPSIDLPFLKSLPDLPLFFQNVRNNDVFSNYDIFSECSSFS